MAPSSLVEQGYIGNAFYDPSPPREQPIFRRTDYVVSDSDRAAGVQFYSLERIDGSSGGENTKEEQEDSKAVEAVSKATEADCKETVKKETE